MNSLKIKLIAGQSRSKKVQVGDKMKSVSTHYKASLPDQFNSEDQDWVDAMNRVLPENEKIEIPKDLSRFNYICSTHFFKYMSSSRAKKEFLEIFEDMGSQYAELNDSDRETLKEQVEERFNTDWDLYHLDSFSNSSEGIIANATGWLSGREVSYPARFGLLISDLKINESKEAAASLQKKIKELFHFTNLNEQELEDFIKDKDLQSKSFEDALTESDKQFFKEVQDTELFKKTLHEIKEEFKNAVLSNKNINESTKNEWLIDFNTEIMLTKAAIKKLKEDGVNAPKFLTAKIKIKVAVRKG